MKRLEDNMDLLKQFMILLEQQFGPKCEIVLHDLTKPYDHTIIDIRNGHLTGRAVGDCGSNLGLEVIRGTQKDGDKYNYITHTRGGKILRSSSMYFRDDEGNMIGSLCINYDITETITFEKYLSDFNHYNLGEREPVNEIFANNVSELVEYFLQEGQRQADKPLTDMTKQEKLHLLDFLDRKGIFLITKAGERVCEALNISKFTLYNYLDILRKQKQDDVEDKKKDEDESER